MSIERPLGEKVDWSEAREPTRVPLRGPMSSCVRLDAEPLYRVSHPPDGDPAIWTYLPDGPYESTEDLRLALVWAEIAQDRVYYAIARLPEERALGLASYLRITPYFGVIEIGHIWFGVLLRRTTAATEAIYLLENAGAVRVCAIDKGRHSQP